MLSFVPKELLRIEACVLLEDTHDVVLQLRLPKQKLADNRDFLGTLLEYADSDYRHLARPARRRSRAFACCTVLAIATVLGTSDFDHSSLARYWRGPAIELRSVELERDVIAAGEDLVMIVASRRRRICITEVDRTWLDQAGNPLSRQRVYGGNQPVGTEFSTRRIKLHPPNLGPGHYRLRSAARLDCGHGDVFMVALPDFDFTVH